MYLNNRSNVLCWQSKCIMAAGETLASLLHRVIHNVIVSASHFLSVFTKANSIVHNCAPVTKHWHTLTRPFHNFYSHLRPHWLFGLGGDLCREIRIWPRDWQNIDTGCNCTIWKSSVSTFFFCLLTLAVRLLYPWKSWMHKSQLIFCHHWQSREMRSLGKQTNNYSHLENVMMKVVVVHGGSTRWPDVWNVNKRCQWRYSAWWEWSIRKKFYFRSQRF